MKSIMLLLITSVFFLKALGAPREQILSELRDQYDPTVRSIWGDILQAVSPEDRATLLATNVVITLDDIPFGFFAGQETHGQDTITITVGGLRTLDMSTLSIAMAMTGVADIKWSFRWHYLVRERLRTGETFIPDPTKAAGITPDDLPPETFNYTGIFRNAGVAFILAHEAAHILKKHSIIRKENESTTAYFARRRKQETAADKFACQTLLKMGLPPIASVLPFAAMSVIYEIPGRDAVNDTHPSSASRLKNAAQTTLQHIDDYNWQGQNIDEVRANLEQLLSAAEEFLNGTALQEIKNDFEDKGVRLR